MDKLTMDLLRIKQIKKHLKKIYLNHGKPKVAMGLLHQPQFIHGILIKLCSKRKKRGFYNFTIIKPWLHFRKDITPCQSSLLFVPYESNIRYLRLFCKISLFKLSVVNFVLLSVKYHIHTCKLKKCKPSFKIFLWVCEIVSAVYFACSLRSLAF